MDLREFQPARLEHARVLRGLQQNKLAEDLGVTPAAISQFEGGTATPSKATLERLSVVLNCLPTYFTRPDSVEHGEAFFRRRRAATKREMARALAYATAIADVTQRIELAVELPKLRASQRRFVTDRTPIVHVERLAEEVRLDWKVPAGPLPNVVRLLEAGGAITVAVGTFERVDAFSLRTAQRPVVVLCSDNGAAARRRFDAAHELGHLLMHDEPLVANKRQEEQAQRFAAALLMPADQMDDWLPRRSNELALLEEGSRTWGVSMQALLYRAKTLGTISEDGYRRTQRRMSAAGWRTREPVELGPAEAPELLVRAVAALAETGTTLGAIAEELGLPRRRLARMLRVPEHHEDPRGEVVPLRATG